MKTPHAALVALMLAATPAPAQDGVTDDDIEQGFDLLQEGSRLMLRGLMERFGPALRDLEGALDDLNAYYPPEILPNGDILIRRRVPLQAPEPEPDPEPDPAPAPDTAPQAPAGEEGAIDL